MSAADKNAGRERGLCTKSLHVLEMFALAARSLRSQRDQIKDERLLSSDICSRGGGRKFLAKLEENPGRWYKACAKRTWGKIGEGFPVKSITFSLS